MEFETRHWVFWHKKSDNFDGLVFASTLSMIKDLANMDVFILSEDISNILWDIVKQWPYFERDTIGKQVVRAADSISANLAECHGRFHYRDKQKFAYYARGSMEETKSWIRKGQHRKLINNKQNEQLCSILNSLGPKLNRLIKSFRPYDLKY